MGEGIIANFSSDFNVGNCSCRALLHRYQLQCNHSTTDSQYWSSVPSEFRPMDPTVAVIAVAQMDALTDQIRVEMDRDKRKQLCHQAQQLAAAKIFPTSPSGIPTYCSRPRQTPGRPGTLPSTGDYQFLSAPLSPLNP